MNRQIKRVNQFSIKIFCLFLIMNLSFSLFSQTNDINKLKKITTDSDIIDENYDPSDDIYRMAITFALGGSIITRSRIQFTSFAPTSAGGFEPVPDDQWVALLDGNIWTRMYIFKDSFFHLGVKAVIKAQKNDFGYRYNSLIAIFNVDKCYFQWSYPIGKVLIGRNNYFLRSTMVFNGPLDGLELNINIPYLDFKTFVGFTGLLGAFNPYFNPYAVTSLDRAYEEESNLLLAQMIIKFMEKQARRIFFATDFDIHFFGQHINPYFLLQYDLNSLFYNLNTNHDVNTFHLGLNINGRIIQNLYYKAHISGLFGTHPTSTSGVVKPIIACALETQLRYSFANKVAPTFILGYALGSGNEESAGSWSDYPSDRRKGFWSDKYDGEYQNKYYYYGKFDGGFVLNPILSNIHSISFKFLFSPVNKGSNHLTIYTAVYETLKLYSTGPISDDSADLEDYTIGLEINAGLQANLGSHFNISADYGLFIPQNAYSDKTMRHKMGITVALVF